MTTQRFTLDQLATRDEFTQPAEQASATFCTHRLRQVDDRRFVFRPTWLYLAFSGVVLAGAVVLVVWAMLSKSWGMVAARLALGAVFAWWGASHLRIALQPIVFDKGEGLHWKGKPPVPHEATTAGKAVPLTDVVGLQLLTEQVLRQRPAHELNLVLANGDRVHLLDHGNEHALSADAESLGQFLGVPVLENDVDFDKA